MAENDENPEENTPEDLSAFFDKVLGGEQEEHNLFEPMHEAWVSLHEMYKGMRLGGFSRAEALELLAAYIYRTMTDDTGMGGN